MERERAGQEGQEGGKVEEQISPGVGGRTARNTGAAGMSFELAQVPLGIYGL